MRLEVTDLRTITDDAPWVRNFEFRGGAVTIGSHSESLLQLPDVEVAPHHASIERVGEAWVYRPTTRDDRQTRINGQPSNGQSELKTGDVLLITHFEVRIEIEPEGAEVEVTQVGRLGELAMIKQFPIPPRSVVRKPDEKISLAAARQKSLGDFVVTLGACGELPAVMEATLKLLEAEFSARMVWMGLRKRGSESCDFVDGRLEGAVSMAEPPKIETYSYRCLNRHQHLSIPRTGDGVTQSVLAVPMISGQDAIGLLFVDTKRHARVFDETDLDFITLVAALIRPTVESLMKSAGGLLAAGLERKKEGPRLSASGEAKATSGWDLVHDFRDKIEPRKLPQWPTLELAHYGLKGTQRAGDVLDVIRMPNGLAAVVVGHVTADPSRTAMAISEIRGAFRVAGLHADPPRVQLKELNWLLSNDEHPCSFDGVVAVINPKTGAFEISTAGRVGAFLIASSGNAKSFVLADAPAVGNSQVIEYKGQTAKIGDGEMLALFTAGAADAVETGQKLGAKRIVAALSDSLGAAAATALQELVSDLASYLGAGRQPDDATIILIRRPSGP